MTAACQYKDQLSLDALLGNATLPVNTSIRPTQRDGVNYYDLVELDGSGTEPPIASFRIAADAMLFEFILKNRSRLEKLEQQMASKGRAPSTGKVVKLFG